MTQKQIKIFWNNDPRSLEKEINSFLIGNAGKNFDLVDVVFQTSTAYLYQVIVTYSYDTAKPKPVIT